jgi:uncharacterized protein (TIGR00369 family)
MAADAPRTFSDAEMLQRFHNSKRVPTSSRTLGFRVLSVEQASRSVEIAFDADFSSMKNTMGQIQGGFLCAMLDECMSVACTVASGMTAFAPTLEMKTSFLRAGTGGPLRGVGRVVKWGRTIAFTEGELYDREGRLLAKATGTAVPAPIANFRK